MAGNAAAGSGVGPDLLHYILGITKAYTTRVGGGPFPTELPIDEPGSVGHHLSTVGQERGTVTGRARRCGWLDAAALKRSIIINGISGLCITKLDVLDGLPEIKVCVGYELDGQRIDILPLDADDIVACGPIYETLRRAGARAPPASRNGTSCRSTRAAISSACSSSSARRSTWCPPAPTASTRSCCAIRTRPDDDPTDKDIAC